MEKEQKEGDSADGEGARRRNERGSRGVGGRKGFSSTISGTQVRGE